MKELLVFFVFVFTSFSPSLLWSQQSQEGEVTIDLNQIENDGKRIEIQRYFGYEDLLSRYLTLPYDISANTSNQGRFFDIGFLLFALFPITLLCVFYKKKKIFYGFILLLILYLGIAFHHSYVNVGKNIPVYFNTPNWEIQTQSNQLSLDQTILISLYNSFSTIVQPAHFLLETITGENDHTTYAILFFLFGSGLLILVKSKIKSRRLKIATCVAFSFCFLWLLLSGGIIWYGFLMIPLLYMIALKVLQFGSSEKLRSQFGIRTFSIMAISLWVFVAFIARISNIQSYNIPKEHLGKEIVNSQLIFYSTGIHDAQESKNLLYRNIGSTFDEINSSESLVYQVGTSMTFEITKNTKRVFQDNTLIDFFKILNKYRDKEVIIDVLRASGYEYIIVDLFTHTLDKTPEQSLVKKFQLFLNTIYDNSRIQLMATDRVYQQRYEDGTVRFINDVFGPSDPNSNIQIKEFGSYAVYKITS